MQHAFPCSTQTTKSRSSSYHVPSVLPRFRPSKIARCSPLSCSNLSQVWSAHSSPKDKNRSVEETKEQVARTPRQPPPRLDKDPSYHQWKEAVRPIQAPEPPECGHGHRKQSPASRPGGVLQEGPTICSFGQTAELTRTTDLISAMSLSKRSQTFWEDLLGIRQHVKDTTQADFVKQKTRTAQAHDMMSGLV